jgi:predicted nucleotidyltransferase
VAAEKHQALESVNRFITTLKKANINVSRIILFGSYATGKANEWSDIDIAIVSNDFSGIPFNDNKMMIPFLLEVDSRIELHPYRPEDFTEDNLFVRAIIKDGVEINI